MKIIKFDQIENSRISPLQCYEWVTEALAGKSKVFLPPKVSLKPKMKGVFYNTMPVIIPSSGYAGVKVVTRYPDRLPSLDSEILLYDLETGENVALLDGNWITAMRTGAVAAHSVSLFAKNDFKTIGFVGLGNTARATFEVLMALFPDRELVLKIKKYKEQHREFAERIESYRNIKYEFCETCEELVNDSDVIVSAVTFQECDMCADTYYKEGVLVVPVHTCGFQNCDLFFDKVFADDIDHIRGFRYFDRFKSVAEVADVMQGRRAGRENDRERILAYNVGIALHDIYFAGKIYELIGNQCADISLNAPRSKFWV